MDAMRWQLIKQLFHDALEYPESRRHDYLVAFCKDDRDLLQQVQALLDQDAQTDSALTTAVSSGLQELVSEHFSVREGDHLGPWRITGRIGEGGMGCVYRGQRVDASFEQEVAIKLIHASSINSGTLQRFETERRILARLNHPNIAHLLDGGTTDNGLPYLVMEYVDGIPIVEHCQQQRLSLSQRLRLFQQVCDAVDYAHRHLVVHRDIKPANILVTADGQTKLLDFGIAKLLNPEPEGSKASTASELRLLTPENASPEQVLGEPITTQTDVYALGTLLYQMLTERKLFDADEIGRMALEQRICEQDPLRPSQAIGEDFSLLQSEEAGESGKKPVSRRQLRAKLSGDLDTIVLKALQKPPERRYNSVSEFREDIDRYLGHFPIRAQPDHLAYRLGKFLRRHRLPVSLGTGFAMAVLVFLVVTVIQTREIDRQREQAQLQAERSNRISEFMVDIFDAADPNQSAGEDLTARELLANGEEKIDQLRKQPLMQAAMLQTIGRVHLKLGDHDKARQLIQRAGNLIEDSSNPPILLKLEQTVVRADLEYQLGDYPTSEASYREALALARQQPGDPARIIDIQLGLVALLTEQEKNQEALPIQKRILEQQLAAHGENSAEVGEARTFLGMLYRRMGSHEKGESELRRALSAKRAAYGNQHLETAHTLNQLARSLTFVGKYDEALQLAREGLQIRRSILGDAHVEVAASQGNIAHILTAAKRYGEAIPARQASIRTLKALFGNDHPYIAGSYGSLAGLYYAKGDYAEAERVYRESIRRFDVLSPDTASIKIASPLAGLGRSLLRLERPGDALPVLQRSLEVRQALLPADNWRIAVSLQLLGEARLTLGQTDRAEPLLIEAWRILMRTPELHPEPIEQTRKLLIALYEDSNRPDMADRYRI